MVDAAVLRPGRFDRLIYVPEPDEEARKQILKIYTAGMPLAKDININDLAKMTVNYSGADINGLCREAALVALRKNISAKEVTLADFKAGTEQVGPTIRPEMENWYKSFMRQVRQVQKPTPLVA
jgi:transitional endoplasmic reticulum ATPase